MPKKILVVDDEVDILELVQMRLKVKGYEVRVAENGKGCMEKIEADMPDLIILDIMMPDINGLTLCGMLKNHEKYKHIPIAMLTAQNREVDKKIGETVKADDYITKPFDAQDLLARVEVLLNRPEASS